MAWAQCSAAAPPRHRPPLRRFHCSRNPEGSTHRASHNENKRRMLILVVDDSRNIRAGISNLVARMGHDVIEAEDGVRALELFRHERPDLVLIDVSMPVM